MVLVSVNTINGICRISLTSNLKTIRLTKEVHISKRTNLSVFAAIAKGLFLLLKPLPWKNKI